MTPILKTERQEESRKAECTYGGVFASVIGVRTIFLVASLLAVCSCRTPPKRAVPDPDIQVIDVLTPGHPFEGGDELAANEFADELLRRRGREGQFTVYVVPFKSYFRVLVVPKSKKDQMPAGEASEIANELIDFISRRERPQERPPVDESETKPATETKEPSSLGVSPRI